MATRVTELVARLNNQVSQAAKDMAEDMGRAAQSSNDMSDAMDKANTTLRKVGQTATQQNKSFNGVEKATRNIEAAYDRLEKRLEDAADAFAKGKITVEQYNDILATQVTQYEKTEAREQKNITTLRDKSKQLSEVTTQTDKSTDCVTKNTGAIKLQSYQVAQIADEFHKWVDQIMAGGSALTATTYQLPNMVQAMGGVKNAAALVLDIMSGPTGLAFAAGSVGAAFYKMGSYAEEEESKLAKLSQQLRATRSDANNMADSITSAANSLEKMPGWDKTTARQVATTIGSTYNFTGGTSDIEALAKVAQDAGTVFGSLEDGLKAVQTAMVDPTAEIQALYQQHLPGVDAQLVEQVKRLQEAGEQGKAYALVMQHLTADTKDAAEQALTPFQQAVDKLRAKTSPLLDAFQDLALAMGTTLLNSITSLLSLPIPAEKTTGGLAGSTVLRNDKHPEMVGMMQINTAFTPKYDVMTAKGNVDEGIMRFQNFLHQTGGNLDDALALYGGFKVGSAGGRQYAASVYGQDLSKLPSDSDALIKQESGRFNLSWGVSNLMRKVALQESGGYQYDQRSKPTSVSPADHATSAVVIDDHKSIAGGAGEAAGAGDTSSSWTAQQEELKARIQLLQKEQDSTTTGSVKWQEYNEALTQTKIALANTLSPQEQITQGMKDQNAGLSAQTGYWRNMAEVVAQFATQARGTGVDQTALSEALAAKQKQLAAAYDDGTVAVQRQAQAQAAMLSVAGSSEQAIQHATNYQQAYNEALEDFNPKTQAFAEAVKARTAALNSETDAQARFEQAQQNSGLQDNLSMIQAQTASIGQNADERSIALARMQAEIQEHRKFGAILPQEAQDYVDLSTRIAEASTEYEHQQQVMDDVTGSISDMADQLSDGVVQGFVQGTSSGMSFKSMLEGVDASMASVIARFAVINPLLNSLDGKSRTTLADIGNLFGDTSTGSSSASSVLSGYGEGNDITSSGWAYSPWEALNMKNQISSSSGSTTGGGMFAGLGNLFSGKAPDGSGIFSSVGSAVSSIGSYMGMAGAAFGIGDMIYNLVAPLFATRKKDYQYVSVGSDGQMDISGHVYKGIHGNDNVASGLQDDLDSINDVLGDTGISIANTGVIGKVGWTKKGKKSSTYSLTDLLPDLDLTSSDSTLNQALQQIMPSSFDSVDTFTQDLQSLKDMADTLDQLHVSVSKFDDQTHITVGHISDYTGDMAKVLSGFDGKTVSTSALESMISNLKSLLDLTNSGAESLVSQVADLRDKYQQAADQAKAYGLDYQVILDKGNAIAQSMLDTETTSLSQSDQSVQARYLAATGDQEGADLANFDVSAAQQRQELEDNWRSYLGDSYADNQTYAAQMADLDKTLAAERLQIEASYQGTSLAQQKEYLDQANESVASVFSNLTSYAQGLLTSDDSPLSTQDQYQVANDNLQSDYQAAMGGDYDALSRIQSDASSYLSLAKTWLGSGTDYAKAYQQTLSLLQSLSSMSTDQITATLMKKLSQESVNATLSVADQIGDLKTALQTELRQLARVMITKKSSLT